jgi:hypothetical protein
MLVTIQSRTLCLLVCCEKNFKIRIYKTTILPVVLYERRLRVFENRLLEDIWTEEG